MRDTERLIWNLKSIETDLWKKPPEPILKKVVEMLSSTSEGWTGSPIELIEFLGVDMKANALTLKLNVNAGRLYNEYRIRYENKRSHNARRVTLFFE